MFICYSDTNTTDRPHIGKMSAWEKLMDIPYSWRVSSYITTKAHAFFLVMVEVVVCVKLAKSSKREDIGERKDILFKYGSEKQWPALQFPSVMIIWFLCASVTQLQNGDVCFLCSLGLETSQEGTEERILLSPLGSETLSLPPFYRRRNCSREAKRFAQCHRTKWGRTSGLFSQDHSSNGQTLSARFLSQLRATGHTLDASKRRDVCW